MKHKSKSKSDAVNVPRRRVIQGVGAFAAAAVAGPALSASHRKLGVEAAELTGRVISQIDSPIKTLILRNNSAKPITIDQFANGGLMFDGEVFDCNGACIQGPVTLSSKKEILVQFDRRYQLDHSQKSGVFLNVQPNVQRMSAGTRVVEISGTANDGVVTLMPATKIVNS